MTCPKCGQNCKQHTIDTRTQTWGTKRTKICSNCNYRYPTVEIYQITKEALASLDDWKYLIDLIVKGD